MLHFGSAALCACTAAEDLGLLALLGLGMSHESIMHLAR